MMLLLTVHLFMKPYKMFYVNLLESVVLVDVLLLLLIASTNNFKVSIHILYMYVAKGFGSMKYIIISYVSMGIHIHTMRSLKTLKLHSYVCSYIYTYVDADT